MSVHASSAKRRYAGNSREFLLLPADPNGRPLPFGQVLLNFKRRIREINILVQLTGMKRRHQLTILKLKQYLGQPGDSRCTFAMPDIGFGRTY
ncbi:hypothetical protein D3C73_443460 [compost metagenome]